MKKFKKFLLSILSLALVAVLSIGGTLAYLKSEDSDVNVMTMGNVKIAQHEYERVENEDGSYNDTYYMIKNELNVNDEESSILMNSTPLNESFQTVLNSIVEYKLHNNIEAKLSDDEIYNLITTSILKTENISDETKSKIINKSSIYREDISDYIYDIEVSLLGEIK